MKKISVSLSGHQTSISLEQEFVQILYDAAKSKRISVAALIAQIDSERELHTNLSSAVRVWILKYVCKRNVN
ncbi:MAG: ribbon-helix-helix domain-containing protein [Alphaproteobacteria bacterium]|nr:ribbon-helix-helix domain-containing protein [Alphaproteobacteria bacterium]